MQSVIHEKGSTRIFYKSSNFVTGKLVTAYIWTPSLVKGSKQTLTELSDGLYYIDSTFEDLGQYIAIFYEDDVPTITRVFTVTETSFNELKKVMTQLLIALFK